MWKVDLVIGEVLELESELSGDVIRLKVFAIEGGRVFLLAVDADGQRMPGACLIPLDIPDGDSNGGDPC